MDVESTGALAELQGAYTRLERGPWSAAQRKQLVMTRGQLERALESGLLPAQARVSMAGLMSAPGLGAFLELAETGAFRRPGRVYRGESTPYTANALAVWSRRLGEAAGVEVASVDYRYAAREPVGEVHLRLLWSYLAERERLQGLDAFEVRFTAMALMALEAAPRAGELSGMRMADLTKSRRAVWVGVNPQRAPGEEMERRRVELSAPVARALRRWEVVREAAMWRVQGGRTALWVSLRQNGRDVPVGMPLEQKGVIRTWAKGMARVNLAMAGEPGWPGPVSVHIEALRRGVEASALDK
jgi:integrase